MAIGVPEEHFGNYKFECGEEVYQYRTYNNKQYSNEEFMNLVRTSETNWMYYEEPCTMWNDPDGNLVMFPRIKQNDEKFLGNVKLILENTENEKVKNKINNILNKCFIIDKEPVLKDELKLSSGKLYFDSVKKFGRYHISGLDEFYRDLINYAAYKYNKNKHLTKTNEMDMEIILAEK